MVLQHHGCLEPDTAQEHCAPPVCPILDAPRDRRLRPTARRFSPFRPCCGSRQVTEVVGHITGVRKPWRRHVAPRMTPGTVQRALLDGPKGRQCDADGNSNKTPLEAGGCQGAERGARRSCKVAWQPRRCPGVVPGLLGCSHAQARLHYQPRPRCVRAQFAPSSELSLHCACCARRQRQSSAAVASIGGAGHCKTLTLPLAPSDLIGHFEFE